MAKDPDRRYRSIKEVAIELEELGQDLRAMTEFESTIGVIAVLVIVVAALASYIPARRATRVDPMVALRYE